MLRLGCLLLVSLTKNQGFLTCRDYFMIRREGVLHQTNQKTAQLSFDLSGDPYWIEFEPDFGGVEDIIEFKILIIRILDL